MHKKFTKAVCLMAALASIMAFPVRASATAQGTSGTELNVVQAQKVEIQLGTNWTGVEFEMKTDAGMYPDAIPIGEDGILRFEVGGSESYILTCLNSDVAVPSPETTDESIPENAESTEGTGETETAAPDETKNIEATEETAQGTDATETTGPVEVTEDAEPIPVVYIVITAVGIVLAVAALVWFVSSQKKSAQSDSDDDDDEF